MMVSIRKRNDFIPSQNRNNIYYAHNSSHIFTPKKLLMDKNDECFISYSDSKMIASLLLLLGSKNDLGETNSFKINF